jgi:HD-like signal output (HDOD) protein
MDDPDHLEYESALHIIEDLNPSVYILAKVVRMIKDPNVEVDDVINVLKNDPAITADIIHVSNSSYYGATSESKDIKTAISQIGFYELMKLISLCVTKNLLAKPLNAYGLTDSDCLAESISIALLMDGLSKPLKYDGQEGYTIGLLSTVGKIVINKAIELGERDDFYDKNEPLLDWEERVIGFDHARAGAMLLKGWEFPTTIIFAILCQFNPDENEDGNNLTYALNISRHLVTQLGNGFEKEEIEMDDLVNNFSEKFNVSEKKLNSIVEKARERFNAIAIELGIGKQ